MRRIQNKVAESRWALPMTVLYGIAIWLLAGLIQQQWWIQFGCFLLSAYLIMHLNNINVLIRIYSRIVSISFIVLSTTAVFLFPSVNGAIIQLCFITALLFFYNCYQDKETPGLTFYTFFCLGVGSIANIHLLYFVPVFWLMMVIIVYSISWRTFFASLVGLLTPYWFWTAWVLWKENGSITTITKHILALTDYQVPVPLTVQQTLLLGLLILLGITGTIHFLRTSSRDKIRTRQLFYSFFIISTVAGIFLILQPQHYDMLIRIMTVAVSPLIGHFLALTKTKITNIAFIVITVAILALTTFNLWISSSPF